MTPSIRRHSHRPGFTLIEMLAVITIVVALTTLLMPAIQQAREVARQGTCKDRMRQIGMGLANYESAHNVFPIGIVGKKPIVGPGNPLTTWQTQILPEVKMTSVYEQYDFNFGFNAPTNTAVVKMSVPTYICPSHPVAGPVENLYGSCHFAGNAGTTLGANDGILYPLSSTRSGDVADGIANTIIAGESAFEMGGWGRGSMSVADDGDAAGQRFTRGVLRWGKAEEVCARVGFNPSDTNCLDNSDRRFQFSSLHNGGCHFALVDGSVRFLNENMDMIVFQHLLTRNGNEILSNW